MTPLPTGPFSCLLADPAWRFKDQGTRISPSYAGHQREKAHYDTMSLDEICSLPVRQVVADDCWLFLWIPESLRDSWFMVKQSGPYIIPWAGRGWHLAVCSSWGGFYPTGAAIVWVKGRPMLTDNEGRETTMRNRRRPVTGAGVRLQIGMGHYTRGAHEVCLICKRGKPARLAANVPSVIVAPRGRHSAKPVEVYDMIERFCAGPRLELFARAQREGWTSWGNEVTV